VTSEEQQIFELKAANKALMTQRNKALDSEIAAQVQISVDVAVIEEKQKEIESLKQKVELLEIELDSFETRTEEE